MDLDKKQDLEKTLEQKRGAGSTFRIHDINNRAASALHRFALVRRGGHEYKLFPSPTRSPPTPRLGAHFPLDVRPLASARVRFCPPAFVGFGFLGGCTPS